MRTTNVKFRQHIERMIARRLVLDAIKAGYTIDVNDSEEVTLRNSASLKAVLAAMFTTDEDYLILHKDGQRQGWVRFIYGNDGWDVISDYTVNLEAVLTGANALADKLGAQ